jgi:hypothetical protein
MAGEPGFFFSTSLHIIFLCLNASCSSNVMFDTLADTHTRKRLYPDPVDDFPKNASTDKRQRLLNDYSRMELDSKSSHLLIRSQDDQLSIGLGLSSSNSPNSDLAQHGPHQALEITKAGSNAQFAYAINSRSAYPPSTRSSIDSLSGGDGLANGCRDPSCDDVCAEQTADMMDLCGSKDIFSCW